MGNAFASQAFIDTRGGREDAPLAGFRGRAVLLSNRPAADCDEALMFGLAPVSEVELPADGGARADGAQVRLATVSGEPAATPGAMPLRSERARTLLRSMLGEPERAAG